MIPGSLDLVCSLILPGCVLWGAGDGGMKLSLCLPQVPRVLEVSVTVPGMSFTGDMSEDDGSMFEGAWVGAGLGFSPEGRWKDEQRGAVGLADVGRGQGHTQGFLSFSCIDLLVSSRFLSFCCCLLPSQ